MDARIRDVQLRALEPRRPFDAARVVEHLIPVARQRDPEVVHDGAPEPVGIVDRERVQLAVAGAAEGACEAGDVRRLELLRGGAPREVGRHATG